MSEAPTATKNTTMNLTYAWGLAPGDIVFYANCDVLTSFGSIKAPHVIRKEILEQQWGITSRETLLNKLQWLKNDGDSESYRKLASAPEEQRQKHPFIKKYADLIGEEALTAWDLGRYCCLVRWGEYVGYLDVTEACRHLLEIATALQAHYDSWEAYFEHFLIGLRFKRSPIIIDEDKAEGFLLKNSDSNWHKLDWSLGLEKGALPKNAAEASPFFVDLSGSMQDVLDKKDRYLSDWLEKDADNNELLVTYARFKWQERRDAAAAAQVFEHAVTSAKDPKPIYEQYAWMLESEIKDPMRALEMYRSAAELGSPMGMTALGNYYAQGIGVEKDIQKALNHFQQAAYKEYAHAQFMIGLIYQGGESVPQNFKNANAWFMRAAKNNFSDAMLYLGFNYEHGQGFPKDFDKALGWYRRSAELNNPVAQYNLGIFYQLGNGVEQNHSKAFQLFQQSALQGYTSAMFQSGWCYHFGNGVDTDPEQAMEWYQRAAARGDLKALTHIGILYHEGLGVQANAEKAKEYYLKAADRNEFAKFQLGRLLFEQDNHEEAYPWIEESAKRGVAGAQRLLGFYYLKGHDPIIKNYKKALKWFEKAAKKNDPVAQYELAEMFDNRIGVMQRNQSKAEYWYERAAELGNADAQFALGWYYETGEMEKPNVVEAYAWYFMATEQGEIRAKKKVEELQTILSESQLEQAMDAVVEIQKAAKVSPPYQGN